MIRSIVLHEAGPENFDDPEQAKMATGTTWIRATDPTPADIADLTTTFPIHELSIEDIQQDDVRPKVEEFDEYTFVLVKAAALRRGDVTFTDELRLDAVGIFIGTDWLVTIAPQETAAVERVWEGTRQAGNRMLTRGPDFVAYRILETLVEEYFGIVDDIETQIEAVEDDVIESPDVTTLERINELRRDLLSIRRLLWPSRDSFAVLSRGDPDEIRPETEKYFRDVYDNLVQLVDLTETYRDLVVGTRDIYLNSLSASTNEVMKKLTVVATIILPLTFVVGVFGMNFGGSQYNMPELQWEFAYPAVMVGMAGIAAVMIGYFRRAGWL